MRILGLDYGTKTVGVAVCDPLEYTAQGLEIIRRKEDNKLRQTLARIEEIIQEYGVEKVVLGFPKHLNNTIGERAEKSIEFGQMIERRTGLPVIMWDERYTTVSANQILMESKVRREDRKEYVDKVAAAIILQGYLDMLSMKKKLQEEQQEQQQEELEEIQEDIQEDIQEEQSKEED